MNKQWKWIGIIFIVSALLAGCTSAGQPQGAATDPVKITLKTNPSAPVVRKIELLLELHDQKDQPLTGAKVDFSADHTEMMGMTMGGPATEQGNSNYATTANFSNSGTWKITVYVRKEGLDFQKDIELKIP